MKKTENMESMLTVLLECGSLDLAILEDVQYDLGKIVKELISEGLKPALNLITHSLFAMGVDELEEVIRERIAELEEYGSEEDEAEHNALLELDAHEDIQWSCKYLDAGIWFVRNSATYRKYLADNIADIEEKMGFEFLD